MTPNALNGIGTDVPRQYRVVPSLYLFSFVCKYYSASFTKFCIESAFAASLNRNFKYPSSSRASILSRSLFHIVLRSFQEYKNIFPGCLSPCRICLQPTYLFSSRSISSEKCVSHYPISRSVF